MIHNIINDFVSDISDIDIIINLLLFIVLLYPYLCACSFVHEYSHKLAVIITSRYLKVSVRHIDVKARILGGFNYSDFYEYLELNRDKPEIQTVIRLNAISGYTGEFLFDFVLYLLLYSTFPILAVFLLFIAILYFVNFLKSSDLRYTLKPHTFTYKPK